MTPSEFRSRFSDMNAGFTSWLRYSTDITVVSCAVYNPLAHESSWLATAAVDRREAMTRLKEIGVHGLKFKRPPHRLTPEKLISAAISNPGSVVAQLPDDSLIVLDEMAAGGGV